MMWKLSVRDIARVDNSPRIEAGTSRHITLRPKLFDDFVLKSVSRKFFFASTDFVHHST